MSRQSTLQKLGDDLFADIDALDLSDSERGQVMRYRHLITKRLEKPEISNKLLVDELVQVYGVSAAQAYRDISEAERVFGRVSNISKQWARYTMVETIREAIGMARIVDDYMGMIKGAAELAKYMRLDKDDPQQIPYEEIVPPVIEFQSDPSIMGVEIENPGGYVEKIKKKYITEVEYTEVKD